MIKTMATNITPQNIMQELNNPKNWKRTSKKIYEVYMCKPGTGVKVQDKISGNPYVVNDTNAYVISGTIGDIEVIDARTLATNYAFIDNTPINGETIKKKANKEGLIDWTHLKTTPKNGEVVWAFHLPNSIQNFPVNTRNGGVYANRQGTKHGYGDFLVCADAGGQPNLNDIIVVNGMVFPTTYDLRAFPGMFPADVTKAETIKPTVSLVKKAAKTDRVNTVPKTDVADREHELTNVDLIKIRDRLERGKNVLGYDSLEGNSIVGTQISALKVSHKESGTGAIYRVNGDVAVFTIVIPNTKQHNIKIDLKNPNDVRDSFTLLRYLFHNTEDVRYVINGGN